MKNTKLAIAVSASGIRLGPAERYSRNDTSVTGRVESNEDVVGVHGVFNMSPTDHFGLDERSRAPVRIEKGAYRLAAN